jgi:hypothetical protein
MSREFVEVTALYPTDTTLRDGSQGEGVSFSVDDIDARKKGTAATVRVLSVWTNDHDEWSTAVTERSDDPTAVGPVTEPEPQIYKLYKDSASRFSPRSHAITSS